MSPMIVEIAVMVAVVNVVVVVVVLKIIIILFQLPMSKLLFYCVKLI